MTANELNWQLWNQIDHELGRDKAEAIEDNLQRVNRRGAIVERMDRKLYRSTKGRAFHWGSRPKCANKKFTGCCAKYKPRNKPRPGEVKQKEWVQKQAIIENARPYNVYMRLVRGKYPYLKFRRVNRRVVFVMEDTQEPTKPDYEEKEFKVIP